MTAVVKASGRAGGHGYHVRDGIVIVKGGNAHTGVGCDLNQLQGPHNAVQPLSHFGGHLRDLGILDELEHGIGVHELNVHRAIIILADH
jgi:hypothetical protein